MRGLRSAVMATLFAGVGAGAGVGCGSLLTLEPSDGSPPPVETDANAAPVDPDGSFAADADASVTGGDVQDAPDGDSAQDPVVMGSLSCGPMGSESDFEAVCLAAVGRCAHEVKELPEGGEPCAKTDASAAGESYCTSCVALGVGGRWSYSFRRCACN